LRQVVCTEKNEIAVVAEKGVHGYNMVTAGGLERGEGGGITMFGEE
jgi:hypothetical protein